MTPVHSDIAVYPKATAPGCLGGLYLSDIMANFEVIRQWFPYCARQNPSQGRVQLQGHALTSSTYFRPHAPGIFPHPWLRDRGAVKFEVSSDRLGAQKAPPASARTSSMLKREFQMTTCPSDRNPPPRSSAQLSMMCRELCLICNPFPTQKPPPPPFAALVLCSDTEELS